MIDPGVEVPHPAFIVVEPGLRESSRVHALLYITDQMNILITKNPLRNLISLIPCRNHDDLVTFDHRGKCFDGVCRRSAETPTVTYIEARTMQRAGDPESSQPAL